MAALREWLARELLQCHTAAEREVVLDLMVDDNAARDIL